MSPEDTSARAGSGNVAVMVVTTTPPPTMEERIPVKASFLLTICSDVVVLVDVVVVLMVDGGRTRSKAVTTTRLDGKTTCANSNMVISLKVERDFGMAASRYRY